MDQPAAHSHRRHAAPDASSSPTLPSPPPPPHHHHRLPLHDARPPPPPPSIPLPSALLPPKKRLDLRLPRKAATPIPSPPPPPQSYTPATPVPSPETLALPAPSPLPPAADSGLLMPPPPPAVSEDDAAPSARQIPAATPKQPSTPPPAPDAALKPAPTRKVRKVVRKVIVKKIVPKGTFAARKAAAAAAAAVASDGSANLTAETTTDKPANDNNVATDDSVGKEQSKIVLHRPITNCNAFTAPSAVGSLEPGWETPKDKPNNDQYATTDDSVDKVQDSDETVEKLATNCNAVAVQPAAGSSKYGEETPAEKLTIDNQGIPAAKSVGKKQDVNETTIEKPATNCNAVAMREASCKEEAVESLTEQTLARKAAIGCDARVGEGVGISERQRMSMKEVFVGGLDRDAKEEDVRTVFGKAGEITQVRMIMDVRTRRNKGYCFVQYREAAQAKNAIAKFGKVKICGKFCRTAAPVGNDNISLGNSNKKKEDVKSIFVEDIPSSWSQAKLTEIFKNYGKIEHIFLSRNTKSSKKSSCACIKYTTHEAAILCLESFDKEELTENGSKVNIKVSLSKPVQRSKQNKEEHTFRFSENVKTVGKTSIQDHHTTYSGEKRPCSTLDGYSSDRMRSHSRPRHGSSTSTPSTLSYNVLTPATTRSPLPSCHGTNRFPEGLGSYYGVTRSSISSEIRQVGAHKLSQPYGRWAFPKI